MSKTINLKNNENQLDFIKSVKNGAIFAYPTEAVYGLGCDINNKDAIFILSVGGGNLEKNVSVNLINAIKYAKSKSAKIFGIVGRDGGYTKVHGDCIILIPTVDEKLVTPISESYQAVIWHSIVSSPTLQVNKTKW